MSTLSTWCIIHIPVHQSLSKADHVTFVMASNNNKAASGAPLVGPYPYSLIEFEVIALNDIYKQYLTIQDPVHSKGSAKSQVPE